MVDRGIMFEHSEDLKKGYKCSTNAYPTAELLHYGEVKRRLNFLAYGVDFA